MPVGRAGHGWHVLCFSDPESRSLQGFSHLARNLVLCSCLHGVVTLWTPPSLIILVLQIPYQIL